MDFFELNEFLKENNPGKKIDYTFPPECHRIYEIVMHEGKPNAQHHVECNKVQVMIEGKESYIQKLTSPHRLTISHEHMEIIIKEIFQGKTS